MMSELGRNSVCAYAAAKGGLKMLTKNMATQWAKYNFVTGQIVHVDGGILAAIGKPSNEAGSCKIHIYFCEK